MPQATLMDLLNELDRLKTSFGPPDSSRKEKLLRALERRRIPDAASLIRFHEILLFLRAYPQTPRMVRLAERILESAGARVEKLRGSGADMSPFAEPEVSGISGTGLSGLFSYQVARHLARRYPREVRIDWEGYQREARLGATLPRFIALLEDDALVEPHPPYREWLRAAAGSRERELAWLLGGLERLPRTFEEKAELYDSLELYLRWELGDSRATRTRTRMPVRRMFYHHAPLIRRSEVSLETEFQGPAFSIRTVSKRAGEAFLALARDTSAVRYRELHGFTHGDPARVLKADLGRGVEVYFCGVPPERRLPLRAYHAAMFFKNGVPAGYVEGLSLFERMEIGFNLYYTFREGETAWLYAKLLRLFHQLLGVTCFSIDPYQIGHENEEAIESGAFWFYRKLGFRPVQVEQLHLMEAEERKLQSRAGYRTPPSVLRRLAASAMIWEAPGTSRGDWDRFQTRNIGLAVARRGRGASAPGRVSDNLSLALALVPDLARWPTPERAALNRLIRAKAAPDEARYLRAMQRLDRLRTAMLRIGSA